ncbi:hypothetical protein CLAFUW4_00024 [Fulvia fulva]|uniref:Heterokaryon incompatibility domain-containing protein n=1 Tax=Passalora fulva TaxID=5499 RepID=A0A9Q8L6G6_PASFU|nr:uncharacterized protein CLAFUR5_00023 [Fulvia fulva]KAK4635323.1 hypothetical protein CLAFUR4_00024 [Fulvia fulva]KAK4637924.1 hypothetical protein CLAFUR0_00024 [Fulvia fulva]UJO11703.1 hypothetical protein CLAFUR5_00023 [Fulvia fulva]WPV09581.1 hypothetical protein CLAFUW4_00024 [Fulvia fulva]WPV23507.1 hypothetical protein CLAFUW7_00024 [Fulvia fulva]
MHATGDVAGQHVAISYTWQSTKQNKIILVDGVPTTVGYNCWLALWQMRLHNVCQWYWIDSICIKHSSHDEKVLQVGMMNIVYAQARKVAICLGDSDSDLLQPGFDRKSPDSILDLLCNVAGRTYFRRLWTVQEFLLAKSLQVFCGDSTVKWHSLINAVQLQCKAIGDLSKDVRALLDFSNDYTRASKVLTAAQTTLRRLTQDRRVFSIADAILRYADWQCTFVQDKIYGLLSLVPIEARVRIPVDYMKPLLQVLTDYVSVYSRLLEDFDKDEYHQSAQSDPSVATVDLTKMGNSIRTPVAAFLNQRHYRAHDSDFLPGSHSGIMRQDIASVITSRSSHFDPRQVLVGISSFACHEVCSNNGGRIYASSQDYINGGDSQSFVDKAEYPYCRCCKQPGITDGTVFSSNDEFVADINTTAPEHSGPVCITTDKETRTLKQVFASPRGTQDGDVLVRCSAQQGLISPDDEPLLACLCDPRGEKGSCTCVDLLIAERPRTES